MAGPAERDQPADNGQASAFRDPIVESRAATTETQDNEITCKIMFYLFENLQSIVYLSSIPVLSKVL